MPYKGGKIRIIIAGGGTGGHIFPGLAIAGALKKAIPSIDILFVGAKGKMEMERVPAAGYAIKGIDIVGYNRSSILKNLGLPFKLISSYFEVKNIIKKFSPDAVIGVGGYSSFPLLRVAQSKEIPSFIHESNSLAGKSNMILGKRADLVFVASRGMEKYFESSKIRITGNPIRSNILNPVSRDDSSAFFKLRKDIKTVLAVGGSLGAKSINDALAEQLDWFAAQNIQLIWQTGKNFQPDDSLKEKIKNPIFWVDTFIDRMDLAYGAADLVISRAGAMAISELKALGKPSILVPYPFAAEDHQTVNAQIMVDEDAAMMVKDSEVKQKLIPTINSLINESQKLDAMSKAAARMGVTNADELIAKTILERIGVDKS